MATLNPPAIAGKRVSVSALKGRSRSAGRGTVLSSKGSSQMSLRRASQKHGYFPGVP